MARNTTREHQTRELDTRETDDYEYVEPNLLDIPQFVTHRFEDQGMKLRWIRISLKGKDDYTNVGKRLADTPLWLETKVVILVLFAVGTWLLPKCPLDVQKHGNVTLKMHLQKWLTQLTLNLRMLQTARCLFETKVKQT